MYKSNLNLNQAKVGLIHAVLSSIHLGCIVYIFMHLVEILELIMLLAISQKTVIQFVSNIYRSFERDGDGAGIYQCLTTDRFDHHVLDVTEKQEDKNRGIMKKTILA